MGNHRLPGRSFGRSFQTRPVAAVAAILTGLALSFQNCAPPALVSESADSTEYSGDSKYRLPAAFEEVLNTGVTCSVAVSSTNVPVGGTLTYTISTTGTIPAGYRIYAYGSKNNIADASEIVTEIYTSLVLSHPNPGYIGGNYIRYFQIRDSLGRALCSTNSVAVTLQGRVCTLTISSSTGKAGYGIAFTTTYGPGTAVPANGILRFNGLTNGTVIAPVPYPGTDYGYYIYGMTNADVGNDYVRRITIHNPDESIYCETNQVRFRVIP